MLYEIGSGDWNPETDGTPFCSCHINEAEHTQDVEEHYQTYLEAKQEVSSAPATGEAPVVGICGAIALMLVCIIALGKRNR